MVKLLIYSALISSLLTQQGCAGKLQTVKSEESVKSNDNSMLTDVSVDDTLKLDSENSCTDLVESFYECYQIAIPTYLILKDSTSCMINGARHCFAVLEPVDLINSDYDCQLDKRRILLHIVKEKNSTRINKKYTNLISNTGGVSSQFNHIAVQDGELVINHRYGNRYSWDYNMYLKINQESLTLKKIKLDCYSPPKSNNGAVYIFRDLMIDNISIDDTLNNNCGCDKFWI